MLGTFNSRQCLFQRPSKAKTSLLYPDMEGWLIKARKNSSSSALFSTRRYDDEHENEEGRKINAALAPPRVQYPAPPIYEPPPSPATPGPPPMPPPPPP